MVRYLVCVWLAIVASYVRAQETDPSAAETDKPKNDWTTFDPAAAIKEASAEPEKLRFERLWTSRDRVRLFQGLAISADGKRVLAVDLQGRCQMIDGDTGQTLVMLDVEPFTTYRSALSPDGSHAAVSTIDDNVLVFDANGKVVEKYGKGNDKRQVHRSIGRLQFTSDGQHLSWVDKSGNFFRGSIAEHKFIEGRLDTSQSHAPPLNASISPDGWMIAVPPYAVETGGGLGLLSSGEHNMPIMLRLAEDGGTPMQFQVATAEPPMVLAQSENLLAHVAYDGPLVLQQQIKKYEDQPLAPSVVSTSWLTAQRTAFRRLAISGDERWLMLAGQGQVELRRLDAFLFPLIADADFENASQLELAADALRLAIVDQDGHLSVLALPKIPELPVWKLAATITALTNDRQYAHLDKIAEVIQDDVTPFPGTLYPKFYTYLEEMLVRSSVLEMNDPPKLSIAQWRKTLPDSKFAILLEARKPIMEGYAARGSGLANTVSPEGWKVLEEKITQGHKVLDELLEQDHPPADAFRWLFEVAKSEGWTDDECFRAAEKLMAICPRYYPAHRSVIEKFLLRWGGETHSGSFYASWVADKVGGPDGDALYARMTARMGFFEEPQLMRGVLGVDFDRVFKGCEALKKSPETRALGLMTELWMAFVKEDRPRLARAAQTIYRERTPYIPNIIYSRVFFEGLVRDSLDRGDTVEESSPRKIDPVKTGEPGQ